MTLRELLLGGPGHDGYAFNADVYCVECGRRIIRDLWDRNMICEPAKQEDTDDCPQPIFFGESDCAQHCGECGDFLYGTEEECETDDCGPVVDLTDPRIVPPGWESV